MNRELKRRRIIKLCDEVRDIDAKLGRFSDHEGGMDGPTWQAYKDGYLKKRALEAIQLHRNAQAIWSKLFNLAQDPAPEAPSKA